ncbi:hypothetical protein N9N67_01545 [Bacteriovoracaceae bacterium]|nr:hypothetical protein [Bacteriovoracaceae bacterium]
MHILIAGQSCSGKSTFLKFCHQSGLFDSLSIIDLDEHLKKNFTPSENSSFFVDRNSLKAFRHMELSALSQLLQKEINSLVVLGGGTLDNYSVGDIKNLEMKNVGLFHFKEDPSLCLERAIQHDRPLTKVLEMSELKTLFEQRQKKMDLISRTLPADNFQTSLKILQEFMANPCQN